MEALEIVDEVEENHRHVGATQWGQQKTEADRDPNRGTILGTRLWEAME